MARRLHDPTRPQKARTDVGTQAHSLGDLKEKWADEACLESQCRHARPREGSVLRRVRVVISAASGSLPDQVAVGSRLPQLP